jgi:hypothetical protein
VGILWIVLVVDKGLALAIESIQSSAQSPNPEHPGSILIDGPDPVVAYAAGVLRIVLVDRKGIAIVLVQPVFRAKPHEPFAILEYAEHCVLRETLFDRDTLEPEALPGQRSLPYRERRRSLPWACGRGSREWK